jgi:RHS repeat-associated protein
LRIDEATATGGTADADLGTLAAPNQPTFYNYDVKGKMVKVQQGKTGDATIQYRYFLYDSLGRLIRVRQPEQTVNTALNKTDPITGNNQWTAGFSYDLLGNVITATDANGTVITNAYDKANRVVTKTYSNEPNGQTTPAVEYFYDGKGLENSIAPRVGSVDARFAKGKLTKATSSVSETRYTQFDYLGRLLQMEQRTPVTGETIATATPRVSSYQYNFAGALVQETYPSGRVVKNEFESDGDLRRVFGQANSNSVERTYLNNLSYTAAGGIERMKLGNGKWETAKFNERLQVTELGLGNGSNDTSLWKVNYEYGELENGTVNTAKNTGNIAKQTLNFAGLPNPIVQTYKYDSLYRLTEAKETSNSNQQNWIQNFGYDRYGNRLTFTQNIGGLTNSQNPTVDPNTNRFVTNQGFVYDKNGNVTSDIDPKTAQSRSFVFNGENRQSEVKNANGVTIGKYYYDGEGKRVKKVTDTEITVFVYSGSNLVAEYSTQTPPQNPTTKYLSEDHLGTPRIITDSVGNVVSRRDFLPFGEELTINVGARSNALKYGTIADNIRQKFTGYEKDDETGLDFAEARMYENRFGRFTAVDPLLASGKSANPQTFNRYSYVGNNPIIITDPLGLDWYSRNDPNKDGRTQYQWFDKAPTDGGWGAVDFGGFAQTHFRVDGADNNGTDLGTIYLNRYGNSYQTQQEFNRKEQSMFSCAGLTNVCVVNPSELPNYLEARKRGTYNFAIGVANTITELPAYELGPFIAKPEDFHFFKRWGYDNKNQAMIGVQTEIIANIGLIALPEGIAAFKGLKLNPFGLNEGYGLFGRSGFKIGSYKIEALYENASKVGTGTVFSIKQSKPNGNLFRLDYGRIHKINEVGLHSTVRFTVNGAKYGSSAQRRWFPTTIKPPFFEPY